MRLQPIGVIDRNSNCIFASIASSVSNTIQAIKRIVFEQRLNDTEAGVDQLDFDCAAKSALLKFGDGSETLAICGIQ